MARRADVSFTVATWNVEKFTFNSPRFTEKMQNITDGIYECGADIVVLQEVVSKSALEFLCFGLNEKYEDVLKQDEGWCYAMSEPLQAGVEYGFAERAGFLWRNGDKIKLAGVEDALVTIAGEAYPAVLNMDSTTAFGFYEGQPGRTGLKYRMYTGKFGIHSLNEQGQSVCVHELLLGSVHLPSAPNNNPEIENVLPRMLHEMQSSGVGDIRATNKPLIAAVGDFNLDAGHRYFNNMRTEPCGMASLLPAGIPTNISGTKQYDNAWVPSTQLAMWSEAKVLPVPAEVRKIVDAETAAERRAARAVFPNHLLVHMRCTISCSQRPAAPVVPEPVLPGPIPPARALPEITSLANTQLQGDALRDKIKQVKALVPELLDSMSDDDKRELGELLSSMITSYHRHGSWAQLNTSAYNKCRAGHALYELMERVDFGAAQTATKYVKVAALTAVAHILYTE